MESAVAAEQGELAAGTLATGYGGEKAGDDGQQVVGHGMAAGAAQQARHGVVTAWHGTGSKVRVPVHTLGNTLLMMLTARPVYTYHGGNRVVAAARVRPPILRCCSVS